MNLTQVALGLSDVLSLALIIRLISLRLHRVYSVFCAFLLFRFLSASFIFIERFSALNEAIDYRVVWLVMEIIYWVLSIWMVYALLQAILENLPGILRASRRALNIVLPLSLAIALLTAGPEYSASGASSVEARIDFLVSVGLVLDRLISTIALLTLLMMLLFILWFPVKMPKNLASFSIGFILYFTVNTVLLLFRNFWSHESYDLLDNGVTLIFCFCLAYWTVFLNRRGELAPVTLGHSWSASRQPKLLSDLESLNAALARAGRR